MDKKRWILWAAVSSLPQAKKISNEDQIALGIEHMTRLGGQLVESLVVPGESRSIVLFEDACTRIDAYARLRAHLEQRDFDVLGYLDRSRLGRTAALSMTVVALCQEAGAIAYEYTNPTPLDGAQSHDSMLIGAIKSVGGEMEIRQLRDRHIKGMAGRTLDGKFANLPPYGYLRDPTSADYRIVVNETEAGAIRLIADRFLSGRGQGAIVEELKRLGYPARRGDWANSTIYWILERIQLYAGSLRYDTKDPRFGVVIGVGRYPHILTRETADAVAAEMERRRGNRKLSSDQCSIFSAVCACAECGRRMVYRSDRGGYLSCLNRHPGTRYVRVQVILDEFKQVISQMSLPSAEEIGLETPKNGHIEAKIGIAQESIARVRKSLHVASTAFVDGILDAEEYQVQKERLNVQIAQLNRQIEQLQRDLLSAEHEAQRAKRTEDFIADALTRLDGPDTREVNAWLRRSVTIYIRDGHIEAIDIL